MEFLWSSVYPGVKTDKSLPIKVILTISIRLRKGGDIVSTYSEIV